MGLGGTSMRIDTFSLTAPFLCTFLIQSCAHRSTESISRTLELAAQGSCESASQSLFEISTSENLLAGARLSARTIPSFLISGMGYATDGLMIVSTGALSFTVHCMLPMGFFIYQGARGSWSEPLCIGEPGYYHADLGEKAWNQTRSWREDRQIQDLNLAQLQITECYSRRQDANSLRKGNAQVNAMRGSPTWKYALPSQQRRAEDLVLLFQSRLKEADPELYKAAQMDGEALKKQLEFLVPDLRVYVNAENAEEWAFVRLSVSSQHYEIACQSLPVEAHTSKFRIATLKQFEKAREKKVFASHPLPEDLQILVYAQDAEIVTWTQRSQKAELHDLLCVR